MKTIYVLLNKDQRPMGVYSTYKRAENAAFDLGMGSKYLIVGLRLDEIYED